MDWKMILIGVIMTLSVLDLVFTFYYVYEYKKWQPNKPYNLIELNPLIVFLWTRLGFWIGSFVSSVIILSLVFIVCKYAHPFVAILLLIVLIFTMVNHANNIQLLWKLIEKFPSGYLPTEIFGIVQGSNPQ